MAERPEAVSNLAKAFEQAVNLIETSPEAGLAAPGPYPELARLGEAWLHVGCYWFVYTTAEPPILLAVFWDAADIPGRI